MPSPQSIEDKPDKLDKPKVLVPTVEYALTVPERTAMLAFTNQILNAKMLVYDLQVQKEQLESQLRQALHQVEEWQSRFTGAVMSLGTTHGIDPARINPDLSRITKAGG